MNVQTANTYKLKVKDIITVVLLALINVVIFFAGSFLYVTPITILLMPVAYALVEGIIFFMIGAKVKKRGAILIYFFVRDVLGSFRPYIILYILAGLIAELLLWKTGYGNAKGLTLSYIIIQVLACIGSTIYPYAIIFESLMENAGADGRTENVTQAAEVLQSWGSPVLLVSVVISAFLGALIGRIIVKKHLMTDSVEQVQ